MHNTTEIAPQVPIKDKGEAGAVVGSGTEQVVETFWTSEEGWNSVDVEIES